MNTYIFPGGCLPSLEVIARNVARRTDMQLADLEDLTPHYVETLRRWRGELRRATRRQLERARLRRALPADLDAVPGLLRGRIRRAPDLRHPAAADQTPCSTHLRPACGQPGSDRAARPCGERMTGSLLDSVLDRSVIGGYTNVGYRIRSRGWSASELPSLDGRVVMVTGATSGLGLAAAEGFARLGATVWLVVRSEERGEQARAAIAERSGNHDVHVGLCDLSDLQSVRQFAERFTAQAERLDVLVNNAGVLPRSARSRRTGSS